MIEKFKLSISSIKENNLGGFLNLIKTAFSVYSEPLHVSSLPIFVQIEPTVICNLKCKMCIAAFSKKEVSHLTLDKFKIIRREFPYLRKISLVGVGEPLLNPELFEIIRFAKKEKIRIGFTTNGVLLTKNNIEKILDCKCDWLNISIDGATKETYQKIRQGSDFELVINNVKELMRAKKGNKIAVSIWFLGMKDNIKELAQMVRLVSDLGIRQLNMQTVHTWGSLSEVDRFNDLMLNSSLDELVQAIRRTKEFAKKYNIEFNYDNTPFNKSVRACKWPWKSCYISVEGFITPCCIHGSNPDIINFGNIFEKPFKEIWNNNKYREFRKKLRSNIPEGICIGCTSYYRKLKV